MAKRRRSKLKEEAPDRFLWRTRLGGSSRPDVRLTTERMNEYPNYKLIRTSKRFLHALFLFMWVTFKPIYYLCSYLLSGGLRHNLPPLITTPTQTSSSLPVYISFPVGHTFLPVMQLVYLILLLPSSYTLYYVLCCVHTTTCFKSNSWVILSNKYAKPLPNRPPTHQGNEGILN